LTTHTLSRSDWRASISMNEPNAVAAAHGAMAETAATGRRTDGIASARDGGNGQLETAASVIVAGSGHRIIKSLHRPSVTLPKAGRRKRDKLSRLCRNTALQ
jgi:hypothetical protein